MALTVTHAKVLTVADGTDTTVVLPSEWGSSATVADTHVLSGVASAAQGGTGLATFPVIADPTLGLHATTKRYAEYRAVMSAITNRQYDAIVKVSTTITAAIASISDASFSKRYMVYVPNGTYSDNVTCLDYIDVVGQSRTGVIVNSAVSGTDTFHIGGLNCMIANLTINNVSTGTPAYPIHADSSSDLIHMPVSNGQSTTIVYNVSCVATGTAAKAGIGIGLRGNQRLYLLESSFNSTRFEGVYGHNANSAQTTPANMYLINVTGISTGVGASGNGFGWYNLGSGQPDQVFIYGGSFSGGNTDMLTGNIGSGAGESYVFIDSNASYNTTSWVDATKILSAPLMAMVPMPSVPRYAEFAGTLTTGPSPNSNTITGDGTVSTFSSPVRLNGSLGLGAAIAAATLINMVKSSSTAGDSLIAGTITNTSAASATLVGFRGIENNANASGLALGEGGNFTARDFSTGSASGNYCTGVRGIAQQSSTRPVAYLYGAVGQVTVDASAGTVTGGQCFSSSASVGASSTLTTLRHFEVVETTGTGTLSSQTGFYVPATFAKGGTNFAFDNASVAPMRTAGGFTSIGPTQGIGYATGAGGTQSQTTDKGTAVVLNKVTGRITTDAAALNANTTVSFTLTNSAIAATDVLVLNHLSGGTAGAYALNAQCGAGSASINIRNHTAGSLSEAIVIAFVVVKGATA